jgi:hypothetical protein
MMRGTTSATSRDMHSHRSIWKRAFGVSLLLLAACDANVTTPPPVENVTYVTNVYTQPQTAVFSGDRAIAPAAPQVDESAPHVVGIAACDAYFAQTESCARSITSDPAALATFEGQVEVARSEAARAEASQDPGQIAHAASACVAALSAYRIAPCS